MSLQNDATLAAIANATQALVTNAESENANAPQTAKPKKAKAANVTAALSDRQIAARRAEITRLRTAAANADSDTAQAFATVIAALSAGLPPQAEKAKVYADKRLAAYAAHVTRLNVQITRTLPKFRAPLIAKRDQYQAILDSGIIPVKPKAAASDRTKAAYRAHKTMLQRSLKTATGKAKRQIQAKIAEYNKLLAE